MDVELWDEGETIKCLRLLPFLRTLVIEVYRPALKYHDDRDLLGDLFTGAMRDWTLLRGIILLFLAIVEERWMKARRRRPFKVGITNIMKKEEEEQRELAGLAGLLVLKQDGLGLTLD
ncbi:hypothetical protein CPB84DRAFT_1747867 [Gymnopilus junonius]|uniref:Uncharacterized protein n=1 Tax=Gymnopilus junonius TaxID=109634 RepID=A0A9P5NMR1_GYMJU|nr:hypothetical protein CPB84DRAFT_1747867 [Gymnopilus junonius]